MNRIKIQLVMVIAAGLLSACGSGNNNGAVAQGQCGYGQAWNGSMCVQSTHFNQNNQACAIGQVSTQFGCVQQAPQGYCNNTPGYNPSIQYGWYNNQCVPATQNYGYNNGGYYNGGQQNYCGTQNGMPMVMTHYNCLPQGNCPMGYGQLSPGQCVPAMNTGYGYPNTGYNGGAYWGWNWGWR